MTTLANIQAAARELSVQLFGEKADNAFTQTGTGAVARTVDSKLKDFISAKDFGAVGDGVTNDTTALAAFLVAVGVSKNGYIPAGTYKVTSALAFPVGSNISLRGDGSSSTTISYAGASTTNDCFVIGDGSTQLVNWTVQGVKFCSATTMTAGVGVHIKRLCRSTLIDVVIDGQDGTGKFYHGVRFNGLDNVYWTGFEARAQHDAVQVNGLAGANPKADLHLSNYKIAGSTNGVRVGGAFGGLYLGLGSIAANSGDGLIIDTTLVAEANREVLVSSLCAIDANGGRGVLIDQSLSSQLFVDIPHGCWVSSSGSHGVYVKNANGAKILLGAYLYNNTGDGVRIDDASAFVDINGLFANANGGYGINPTVTTSLLNIGKARFVNNTLGEFNRTNNNYISKLPGDFIQGDGVPFRNQSVAGTLDGSGNAVIAHGQIGTYYKQVTNIAAVAKTTAGALNLGTVNYMDGTSISVSFGAPLAGQPVWVTFWSTDAPHTSW